MSIVASVALLAAMIVIQSDRPSLTVFGTKPSAENGTADVKKKAATTPALIIESQKIEAENDSGEGGRYTWKLKGESVENMTIRVLHIENGKTSIVSESVYQGGTPGEQRIEVELKLKDSQEPMPSPGNMLTPTLAVSVNGLQAKAETGEKFIFPGAFQGHSESNNGPIASGKVLGWFAYNHKEVEVDGTLESIVEASKNSAAFLVTTVDWKGYEQTPTKEITDDINDIQGTWQVTSLESEGALIMEDSIHELQHVFAGNALTQIVGKKQNLTEFELDPSVSPKTIDIVSKGKTQFGIYELDGDNLRLCLADPRPKEFDSRNGRTIATFKRVAKKTVERKDNGYSLEGITIRETQLTSDGQLEITYETLVESMWYCPGANGVMGQEGLELTFPRVFYNKKIDVDYPSSNKKESTVRTIKVDPKNKPVFIVSNEKRVKIWEPNDKVQIHQDSAQPRDPELPGAGAPQESLSEDQRVESDKTVDLRKLLEQAIANERSKELVVRIGACMGEADNDVPKDAKELVELWEFTSGGVHRVKWDYKEGRPIYRRLESRNCDFEEVCQELLNGRALEIRERKGTGPETVLAGTPYGRGSRSIEVECEGKIVLELHETNGPIFDAYPESDAIAFGKLYDQLAMRARAVLGPKAGEISKLNWRGSGMVEKFAFKGGFFLSLNEKIPGGLKSTPKAISLPRYGVLKISPQGRTVPIYVMLDAATGQPGTLYVNRKADGEMLAETGHPMTRLSGKNRNGEEWSWHCTEVSLELPFAEGNRNANVKFMRANQDKEYFETDIGYISDYGYAGTATIHGKPIPTMVHILDGHANLNCWFDFNGDGIIDPNEKVEQDDSFLFEGRWWSVVSVGNDGTIRLDAPSMYLDKKETITADQAVALEKRLEENPDARDFRYALRQLFMYYRDEVKDKQKAMAILEREYQYAIANLNSKDIKRMLREQFFCCVGAEAQEQALVALEREHAFLIKEARRDYSALSENLRDWVYRLTKANDTVGIAKAKELMLRAREELVGATNKEVVAQLFAVCEGYCSRPKIGDTLDIAFTALDGTKVDLATMKGKVVLVDFWATWCAPCVASQPEIKAAYEKYHDKGFEVIGISLDDAENKDKVVDLLKDKKLPWPQSFDGKGWETPAAVTYGISAIPATFLIDKEGKVIALNLHGVDLETKLAELLK